MQSILFRGMFRYEDTHLEIIFSHDFMSNCYLTWLILICNEVVRSFIARECRKIFRIPRKFQVNSLKLGIDGISKKVNNTGELFYCLYSKGNAWSKVHQTGVCISGVRNVRFLENLACFVFLKHSFWDLPFCLIIDEVRRSILDFVKHLWWNLLQK